jgi:hypothetical protein
MIAVTDGTLGTGRIALNIVVRWMDFHCNMFQTNFLIAIAIVPNPPMRSLESP